MPKYVFLSHSGRDDAIVAAIRKALEATGIAVWDDARHLTAGDQLEPEIRRALDESRALVAVLSPRTVNSKWVTEEIRYALNLQKQRGPTYKVIPVMLEGIEPAGLHVWFTEEPLGLRLEVGAGGIQNLLPDLLDGLGTSLPSEAAQSSTVEALPIADLTLELCDPYLDRSEGKHRGAATAELIYRPAEQRAREVKSRRFNLVAPLGPIEVAELRWYLERYAHWPSGVFQERARNVEERLPEWGRLLHKAALEHEQAREAWEAWKRSGNGVVRRLTVLVDSDLIASGTDSGEEEKKRQVEASEASTLLLGLPWELLHDNTGYLFHGPNPVRVRRRLPNRTQRTPLVTTAPLRVLLLSPRPEDEGAAYVDHRVSARPVAEALSSLGELADLKVLSPPTLKALTEELDRAQQHGEPYHVVHFNGHGVYLPQTGQGALCFERAEDSGTPEKRRSDLVDATKLAEVMRDQRVQLLFLEACQTAVAEKDPTASVAGTLLQGGMASVVAMSHAVLVETARRFVTEFYRELLAGRRIGDAMVAAQRELKAEGFRHRTFQGDLSLEDWFVPVLYQEEDDPQLIRAVPTKRVQEVLAKQRGLSLGELPAVPEHGFVGRSRELLMAERLLENERYVVLCGEGGEGKTTLAAELARWLVLTRRYERAAFVSLEKAGDARSLLSAMGSQLVVDYESRVGQDPGRGWLEVERALRERRTLLVLDNMESVLPPEPGAVSEGAFEPEVLEEVRGLAARLNATGDTRVVFTSRQAVPPPFASNRILVGRLSRHEAIELVAKTLRKEGQTPLMDDPGESEDEVGRLVDSVGCHSRSLVLLAREVADSGVRNATERLGELMRRLHDRYPEDRERSLYASVELSLRRLPTGMREAIRPLGVFQGGGHLVPMAYVLGLEKPQVVQGIIASLVRVGLAKPLAYGYVRLDPALGPLLLSEMGDAEQAAARLRWAHAMGAFTRFLSKQLHGNDPRLAPWLTLADLANLLVGLEHLAATASAERVVEVATEIEMLLQYLGRPKALARASLVREKAASALGLPSHARFLAENEVVTQDLRAGRIKKAIEGARKLLARTQAAGEGAYTGAAFDLARAHFKLGRALREGGDAAGALAALGEARDRFSVLAEAGDQHAARMVSVGMVDAADCLRDLGRLGEATTIYEEGIRLAEQLHDARQVAVGSQQLGTLQLFQRRYPEALEAYQQARSIFEQLGESYSVAAIWHQIGNLHTTANSYDEAEKSYQAALRIAVQNGHRAREAATLNQLGLLYERLRRREESVRFFLQASRTYRELDDEANEGRSCYNVGHALVQLGRHEEARPLILRAIHCQETLGHAVVPWLTFKVLAQIERAAGNVLAAELARKRAVDAYRLYRRDGGENLTSHGAIFAAVATAIASNQIQEAVRHLAQLKGQVDLPPHGRVLLPKLLAVLDGSRDPQLAADQDLNCDDAAELEILLEHLSRIEGFERRS